jgi:hypothetical protein
MATGFGGLPRQFYHGISPNARRVSADCVRLPVETATVTYSPLLRTPKHLGLGDGIVPLG